MPYSLREDYKYILSILHNEDVKTDFAPRHTGLQTVNEKLDQFYENKINDYPYRRLNQIIWLKTV